MLISWLIIILGISAYLQLMSNHVLKRIKESKKAKEATFIWCDMSDKLNELLDDPAMTSAKWREWLPIFEAADECFAKTHPYITSPPRLADTVRQIIA